MDNRQKGGNSSRNDNKAVRWTGRDDHTEHDTTHDNSSNDNDNDQGDYFTYSNASGNRQNQRQPYEDEQGYSSSSSNDSDSNEDEDEDTANTRAATRANTWFNRLRQEDDADLNTTPSDDESDQSHPLTASSSSRPEPSRSEQSRSGPSVPQIRVSEHPQIDPYSHIMDIGTKVSGGLAPGGSELNRDDDNDDVEEEYRHRRDRLLASLGSHSQPTSPHDEIPDPYNTNAIPLRTLAPLRSGEQSHSEAFDANDGSTSTSSDESSDDDDDDARQPSRNHRFNHGFNIRNLFHTDSKHNDSKHNDSKHNDSKNNDSKHNESKSDNGTHNSSSHKNRARGNDHNASPSGHEEILPPQPAARRRPSLPRDRNDAAAEAQALRLKLERNQSDRAKRTEEILANRRRREHARTHSSATHKSSDSNTSSHFHLHRHRTDNHSTHTKSDDEQKEEDSEEEELRRLEEVARQEAELHAKLLVKSHLGSNILKPGGDNNGYVDNPRYLLDAGLMDEDIPLEDEEDERNAHTEHHQSGTGERHAKSNESDQSKSDGSSSSDTLNNEKGVNSGTNPADDDTDSDSDSDEENRNISLRGDPDYVPPPKKVKEGVLGSLLRLYAGQEEDTRSSTSGDTSVSPSPTPSSTPLPSPSSGVRDNSSEGNSSNSHINFPSSHKRWTRPGYLRTLSSEDALGRETHNRPKWFKRPSHSRTPSISHLASSGLAAAGGAASNVASAAQSAPHHFAKRIHKLENEAKEKKPFDEIAALREKEAKKSSKKAEQKRREKEKALKKARLAEQARITIHIADVLQRQRFLLRLGRALMLFGAPSHRLEEYLKITSRVLELDVQVMYVPGCLLFSFGDATTHTSETKLLKVTQGLNLQKLHYTHLIYKEVVHDLMSLEEASSHIDHLLRSKNIYSWWIVVIFYGLACVCCGMFAYGALWKDMPIIFVIGAGVGFLQFWVQPKSDLYANVFEVSSSIVVSFLGRAFGSIGRTQDIFCFPSIVQASISLILPGYIILVGALELQTKNLVAGSVRMFYANIYSLFLSFGITLGSAIYGWIDGSAVTRTSCVTTIDPKWKILFVPTATLFMAAVNQASPRQLPVMVLIGSAGYAVQYFVQQQVENASSFTSAIGAFTLGVLGNLYSRVGHGLAFAAMLPGIFVLVPSGVAAHGYIVQVATQITNASSHNKTAAKDSFASSDNISELGNTMTQVAVGIVVGLFAATLVVYPLGFKKKRSGLFTF